MRTWKNLPVVVLLLMAPSLRAEEIITLAQAEQVAASEVVSREGWSASRLKPEGKPVAEGFAVTVWRMPPTPGGFRSVTVSRQGRVLGYRRGR